MAVQEILLLQPIANLGDEGDRVKVRAGYARNFLLPQSMAIPVSRANRRQVEALQKRRDARKAQELGHAQELAQKLEALSLAFVVKTGEGGKMFGAITAMDLLERLKQEGVELDRKQVSLHTPVKSLGRHTTKVKLHPEVQLELAFDVVSENPIED